MSDCSNDLSIRYTCQYVDWEHEDMKDMIPVKNNDGFLKSLLKYKATSSLEEKHALEKDVFLTDF